MANILVVEDEATVRETLALNLRAEGYEVATAAEGEAGLTMAREKPYDLAIYQMGNGLEQAFLYEPMRGYGVARVCKACREPAACAICRGPLRSEEGHIRCTVCGAEGRCSNCGACSQASAARESPSKS